MIHRRFSARSRYIKIKLMFTFQCFTCLTINTTPFINNNYIIIIIIQKCEHILPKKHVNVSFKYIFFCLVVDQKCIFILLFICDIIPNLKVISQDSKASVKERGIVIRFRNINIQVYLL